MRIRHESNGMEGGEPKECGSTKSAGEGRGREGRKKDAGRRGSDAGASDTTRHDQGQRTTDERPWRSTATVTATAQGAIIVSYWPLHPHLNSTECTSCTPSLHSQSNHITAIRIIPTGSRSLSLYGIRKNLFCVRDMTTEMLQPI